MRLHSPSYIQGSKYDYSEAASTSSVATDVGIPCADFFADESLGETVIHYDEVRGGRVKREVGKGEERRGVERRVRREGR